ncbi:ImmA/IrrE family metallo-endopeptidase [Priestia megaterium]|uniref:ImmA/IrrE family metallo-endopeptidase n=1 Tax=Priestia megaterium TaxID=1404 RepID=UPI0021ACC09B|nr:ImmA/IrrE family metallo-endopeptidase [Priestia megaterium]MCR8927455.1 ImmA/IrrE family metallo-endopeptidase [Priestia megaterium]
MTGKRKAINQLAYDIRNSLALYTPINNINDIPKILGGEIEFSNYLENDMEAMIEKTDENFVIRIKDQPSIQRMRFSIAHELGHLFLHMGYLINESLWSEVRNYKDSVYYRNGYGTEENEANEFAGAFLMPEEEFKTKAKENLKDGLYDIDAIATHFNVSVSAAIIRGKWLGLFGWED